MTLAKPGDQKDAASAASRDLSAAGPRGGSGQSYTSSPRADSSSASHQRHGSDRSSSGTTGNANGSAPAYGALDLGTNNCRLLVARPSRRGFMVVDAFSRIIRLGEGVTATGRLSDVAMDRTIDALKICAQKLNRSRAVRSRLVATEACRIAVNGQEFLDRVLEVTGLDIEVLSRESEARLAVSGCAALLDGRSDLALVFDIGGGSSELIWLDLSLRGGDRTRSVSERVEAQNCIAAWTSLPVGVVTLAERFGGRHVTREVFDDMVDYVHSYLEPFEAEHRFREKMRHRRAHLLGTSGTVTTVAGIHLGLRRYDRARVDGCWMRTSEARAVTHSLIDRSYEERVAEPCIGRERADLVLAGCAILEAIAETWPCESLRVADRGLREGILASMMAEDGVYRGSRRRYGAE